ncbi:MAG TPA: sigma 54-interacting transcriptional regulator [Pirellulales bacterium]|jgi:transcriptional regulator with GAF, ATPase, and Fis domain|nr:sigma 54-interacting transcriptional regulator [Pirellulales bacterium]
MDRPQDLLLDVWREACRHIEINESTTTVAKIVGRVLPLDCLMVCRFDVPGSALEPVAFGRMQASRTPRPVRMALPANKLKRIIAWAGETRLAASSGRPPSGVLALLLPEAIEGDVLAGPLGNSDGPAGALILVAAGHKRFTSEDRALAEMLLEPFSVALENARRLHELTALREAAEADRRSLLTRLGRREISETIVGSDSGLRPVMERIEQVARSDVPVLILGETGTGKEVVARAIHTRSRRAAAPFIRVNCGAIPDELIDSQLFGHERGSFTGATDTRKGWFERADGGTLFLDEIGELPLAAQVRLLRVLQDGELERVGGEEPIRVDVRMVAATHRDLATMVKEATFREDLWYRVAVFPILLPPLRDRPEDISALVRHFAERAATRFGLALAEPSAAELQLLLRYHWPGNIRELGAVIDRAAILGEGKSLEIAQALGIGASAPFAARAPVAYREPTALSETTARGEPPVSAPAAPLSIDSAMRQHIEQALAATRGRIEGVHGAAALLQINPHTLRARMRKLKIVWRDFRAPR